ncbi:hypothetical protein FNV43_RR04633 [Rhamnella rubrinervis]|uniref:Uncharacterized protein n=1 Tax=Rhamnella rubrinervis TaxID=2594499 RepID=A0A8K0HJW3_9ROSA|nr:hypothetical protein FNV43_RR04633 [Rhamnella rubrinervis]
MLRAQPASRQSGEVMIQKNLLPDPSTPPRAYGVRFHAAPEASWFKRTEEEEDPGRGGPKKKKTLMSILRMNTAGDQEPITLMRTTPNKPGLVEALVGLAGQEPQQSSGISGIAEAPQAIPSSVVLVALPTHWGED